MARVSVFQGGNIAPAQTTDARFQAQDFGPGIGAGVARLGQGLGEVADVTAQIAAMHDEAAVKEAANGINEHYAEIGYTGQNAYYDKKGRDALDLRPTVEKSLDELIKQRRGALQSDNQRKMFDLAVDPQRREWGIQIARHGMNETRSYAANEATARAGSTAEMAGLVYIDDPDQGEKHLEAMRDEFEQAGKLLGHGPAEIAAKQLATTSGVYQNIGLRLAAEGPQGPELAQKFVELHAGSMTADDRERVLTNARVRADAMEADRRRAELDQRRLEREARTDARDRAQSAATLMDSGEIPLEPEQYTSALADAKASGDEALVRRLEVGQAKNNLTIQYRGSTPGELQGRVSQLAAEIAKAGNKAKPEWIMERDHLQGLLNNSRAQLNRDPYEWAASNRGISVKPLNLADPASVRQRLSDAGKIAGMTGAPPRPFTQDEVPRYQQILEQGDVQAKVGLALQLGRMGPLALAGAEQLTSNPAYLNIVGLATHSNKGVAASRVNQVITGYEVIKTRPKLIDKAKATGEFNRMVGGALQFLPQVRQGVLSNATAIFASEANSRGIDEWGKADDRWFAAVNSALGAYSKGGKQIGGLASFNGGVTVLPENMSADQFEERIAKSSGPQFARAANGDPVYADGRMPTATDVKRMQWVPAGDNIYRIGNGNEFLKTKDGRDYLIDVSKLNFDGQLAAAGYSRY